MPSVSGRASLKPIPFYVFDTCAFPLVYLTINSRCTHSLSHPCAFDKTSHSHPPSLCLDHFFSAPPANNPPMSTHLLLTVPLNTRIEIVSQTALKAFESPKYGDLLTIHYFRRKLPQTLLCVWSAINHTLRQTADVHILIYKTGSTLNWHIPQLTSLPHQCTWDSP